MLSMLESNHMLRFVLCCKSVSALYRLLQCLDKSPEELASLVPSRKEMKSTISQTYIFAFNMRPVNSATGKDGLRIVPKGEGP